MKTVLLLFVMPCSLVASTLDIKKEMELYLKEKVERILQEMVGQDKYTVAVNVDLSHCDTIAKILKVDPNSRVRTKGDSYKICEDERPPFGGLPGTYSNISERLPLLRRAMRGSTRREERVKAEYEYTRTMEIIRDRAGEVTRLTVAVAIDESVGDRQQAVENVVCEVVGLDGKRGDSITVEVFKFYTPPPPQVVEEVVEWYNKHMGWIAFAVALLGLVVGVVFHMRKIGPRTMLDIPAVGNKDEPNSV